MKQSHPWNTAYKQTRKEFIDSLPKPDKELKEREDKKKAWFDKLGNKEWFNMLTYKEQLKMYNKELDQERINRV